MSLGIGAESMCPKCYMRIKRFGKDGGIDAWNKQGGKICSECGAEMVYVPKNQTFNNVEEKKQWIKENYPEKTMEES